MDSSSSKNNDLTTCIALLSHTSRIDDIIKSVEQNIASLHGVKLVISQRELGERFVESQRLESSDPRLSLLPVEALGADDAVADVHISNKILSGEIKGVIFMDPSGTHHQLPDLYLLSRVCDSSNVPLAINTATADLALRGLARTRLAYLIFNPVAGQGDSNEDLKLIRSILEPTMILHVVTTEQDRDVADQVKEIVTMIQANPDYNNEDDSSSSSVIIASGGDGTVSAVAGATISTGISFGAIPRGTANAFLVALGIPTDVADACHTILSGHARVIDSGVCNNTPFINLAGIGFEAGLVHSATRELKNVLGNIAYVLGGVKQAIEQEPFTCHIKLDGEEEKHTITTKVITVANVAPSSSIFAQGFGNIVVDDGLFEVTIVTGTDGHLGELESLASLWVASLVKTEASSSNVIRVRTKSITVDCDPPQKLLIDGEVIEEMNPVTFKCISNGLTVITNPNNNQEE